MTQEAFKTKGNEAFKAKRYQEAIDWYSKGIEVKPDAESTSALYSNRSGSYLALGHHYEALRDAEQTIRVKPAWMKGYYRKGLALEGLHKLDDAVRAFGDALKAEPQNEEIQLKVADLRQTLRRRNESMKPSDLRSPEDAKVIGNSLFGAGQYERASAMYSRAIELSGREPTAASAATSSSGNSTTGTATVDVVMVWRTERANYFANRAACFQQIHDFTSVVRDTTDAISLVPHHIKALHRRGIAQQSLERWQKALEDFQQVSLLSPGLSGVSDSIMRCQRALRF